VNKTVEIGGIAKIVPWDCEGIEQPYGWSSAEHTREGSLKLKGKKKIPPDVNALVVERIESPAVTVTDNNIENRVYYWCISEAGRLLVDTRFVEPV
jgi:hypothetical protein